MLLFRDLAIFSYSKESKNDIFLGQKDEKFKNHPVFMFSYVTFNLKTNLKRKHC